MSSKSISPSAISGAIRMAQEHGTASERAAVVKWLRADADILAQSPSRLDNRAAEAIEECADAIERSEHLEPKED